MISSNYIPEKISEYNAYLDGTKMIGVAASVTLPEVNMKTSTVSGVGVNGELDSPTIGQFESMEQEIQFNTLYSSAMDMLSPLSTVNLTLRASQQVYDKQGGYNFQYWFVPKGTSKASVEKVDGSYWQTGNEYSIYVYHRGWGERYDRLIGVKSIQ